MRVVLQKVTSANVDIDGACYNSIGAGYVLLIGLTQGDNKAIVEKVANKVLGLRIFEDEAGKMNLELDKNKHEILAISQFTLYGNVKKGKRPSFIDALHPDEASPLYDYFCEYATTKGYTIKKGIFGAMMQVALVNDGPVTILIDSNDL